MGAKAQTLFGLFLLNAGSVAMQARRKGAASLFFVSIQSNGYIPGTLLQGLDFVIAHHVVSHD